MKKWIYIPIIGIIVGTFLISYDKIYYSLWIYTISILTIILMIILGNLSLEIKNILRSLILLPLLQIINLSVPQFLTITYLRYILTCAIMCIPIYSIVKNQYEPFEDSERNFRRLHISLPIIILMWTVMIVIINLISGVYKTSIEILAIGGEFATIFLIISLSISVFVSDTKYWNRCNSYTLDMCTDPMLVVFVTIAISKVMPGSSLS